MMDMNEEGSGRADAYFRLQLCWTPSSCEAYGLLHVLTGKADHYHPWATEYYEMPLDRSLVQRMFEMEPLDKDMLKGLNDELELADLEEDIREIGYPVKG